MRCPRCKGFLYREADPYGATEQSCVNCGWHETVGFVPITEDPNYKHHVREGQITQARMTVRSIEKQEHEAAYRAAWQREKMRRRRSRL